MSDNIKGVLGDLNKKYGAGSISFIDKNDKRTIVEPISTNCFSLDQVFGCGGMPRGRIIDVFGGESSGKSTIAMYLVAQIQKNGGTAAWVDAEMCFTSEYAEKIGVDVSKLILTQPQSGEQALDTVEALIKKAGDEVDIIVIDSTAALVPEKELENDITKASVADQARLLSKGLRKITGISSRSKTVIMFISQVRDKIGMFVGPTTDSTGGKALKFYSSVRLKVQKIKTLKKGDVHIGNRLRITGYKNKVSFPNRIAEIDLYFEKGLDVTGDIFDVACKEGIIARGGTTYSYAGEKIAIGRDKSIEELNNNKELFVKIKEQILLIGQDKDEKALAEKKKR